MDSALIQYIVNIMQYFMIPIQYIAIFYTTDTIYLHFLHHKYNILQYSAVPIQYIGKNVLQYIFSQSIFAGPWLAPRSGTTVNLVSMMSQILTLALPCEVQHEGNENRKLSGAQCYTPW